MIVSSMQLYSGRSVRQIGGALTDLGDPRAPASWVSASRPLFVTDLDVEPGAVNTRVIPSLCASRRWWITAPKLTVARAQAWLDAGAEQVVVPVAVVGEFLEALPPGTVVIDLVDDTDAVGAIEALRGRAGGFRVRFDADLATLADVVKAAGDCPICAVGVDTVEDLRAIHGLGVDVELPLQGGPLGHQEALTALTPPLDAALPFEEGDGAVDDPYQTQTVSFLDADESIG